MALALLVLGLTWRVVRYLLRYPIWGDEAMLAVNFVRLDYSQLTRQLEYCQIAPLLFLWAERAMYCLFGGGELSMRLVPFLAGTAALVLYWQLTELMLTPLARVFAVGFLAVAIWPVSMCTVIKPYSLDLLAAVALTLLAARWLQEPRRAGGLVLLTAVAPLTLLASYPAAFVAGGVSLALLPAAWRNGWRTRAWFAAYNAAVLAAFAVGYAVGTSHLDTPVNAVNAPVAGVDVRTGMDAYWADGFPPANPLTFVGWFVVRTTGQMAAYPAGSANGGSTLTVIFAIAGVVGCARQRRWAWLTLLLAPGLLNVVAAAMHRYPYGMSGRLSQHLAPAVCTLAGIGLATAIESVRLPARRTKWAVAVAGLFAVVGLGGMALTVAYPYRQPGFRWMRATMADIHRRVPPAEPVVVCGEVDAVFAWYWAMDGERVTWTRLPAVDRAGGRVWGFHNGPGAEQACERLAADLNRQAPGWRLTGRLPYSYAAQNGRDRSHECALFCFERSGDPHAGTPPPAEWARGQ